MSFTDGKPFEVTAQDIAGFTRFNKRFNCALCDHVFNSGDTARWIYANSHPSFRGGNFFVCPKCDGPNNEVILKAQESLSLATKLAHQWGIAASDWDRY